MKDQLQITIEEHVDVSFRINGVQTIKRVHSSMLLIDMIRDELGLKGTKPGCYEGECGACTVLVDGSAVNSCLYLAVNVEEKEVTTIEGLAANDGSLDPVQVAMIENGAVQCGFCTSGMTLSLKSFQKQCNDKGITPDREDVKKGIEGNLCRCTGYSKIIDAGESLFKNSRQD